MDIVIALQEIENRELMQLFIKNLNINIIHFIKISKFCYWMEVFIKNKIKKKYRCKI